MKRSQKCVIVILGRWTGSTTEGFSSHWGMSRRPSSKRGIINVTRVPPQGQDSTNRGSG